MRRSAISGDQSQRLGAACGMSEAPCTDGRTSRHPCRSSLDHSWRSIAVRAVSRSAMPLTSASRRAAISAKFTWAAMTAARTESLAKRSSVSVGRLISTVRSSVRASATEMFASWPAWALVRVASEDAFSFAYASGATGASVGTFGAVSSVEVRAARDRERDVGAETVTAAAATAGALEKMRARTRSASARNCARVVAAPRGAASISGSESTRPTTESSWTRARERSGSRPKRGSSRDPKSSGIGPGASFRWA